MKEVLLKEYSNIERLNIAPSSQKHSFDCHFVDGPFIEIIGPVEQQFRIKMINQDNDKVLYENTISNNMWTRSNIKYYVNWRIEVYEDNEGELTLVKEFKYNAQDKRVYIHIDSKALGDTLAWFPHIEEFRKQHQCHVVVSTFHNDWFQDNYPELEFIKPGERAYNLYAKYAVGWHYTENGEVNYDYTPSDFRKEGLQQTSSNILGTITDEIKPKLTFKKGDRPIKEKYVCIAPHASAHAKYWNREGGWQEVIDYLNTKGYKVLMITKEPLGDSYHDSKLGGTLTGVIDKTGDYPLEDRASDLMNSELFIGLGSGLSWVSWALNVPTVLISGFSKPYSEFKDCARVFTPSLNTCNGCFNKEKLDAGDWEWCPFHKDTDRHFECTKTITPQMVIDAIESKL